MSDIPDFVIRELAALGLEVPGELLARLARYLDMLLDANRRVNLTGITERDAAWRRHIIDSLTLLLLLDDQTEGARWIDVGSGGGLPGVPVAIARPDVAVTLLEATGKKARFLESCVHDLPLASTVVLNQRAELAGRDKAHRQTYDVALCRAVGPLRELLEYTLPLVRVGGRVLAMKGPRVENELADAGDALAALGAGDVQIVPAYPEGFAIDTVIVVVSKERPTPAQYPRVPGTARRSPL